MRKVFLSHRSSDKFFVDIVARKLGENLATYDASTFKETSKTLDEIISLLNGSDIFVFFISRDSLNWKEGFDWVKYELENATRLLDSRIINTLIPIIIDKSIDHTDGRIPKWIRDNYNLKYIGSTDKCYRIIKSRIVEMTWQLFPNEKKRKRIFAGRTEYVGNLEMRLFDGTTPPIAIIASGMNRIGRKAIIRYTYYKTGILPDSAQEPISIALKRDDGIEDLIIKLYENGNTDQEFRISDLSVPMDEKIEIATEILGDALGEHDQIFITDDGCIVNTENKVAEWFDAIVRNLAYKNRTCIAVASKFRLSEYYRVNDAGSMFYFNVSGLNKADNTILLNQLLSVNGLSLTIDQRNTLLGLFKGFPEQVYFTINLLQEYGYSDLLKKSYLIIDYNSQRVFEVIKDLDVIELGFLRFLAEFDYISYEHLTTISEGNGDLDALKKLFALNICEPYGGYNEFVSVEASVRDYIQRNMYEVPDRYKDQIHDYIKNYLTDDILKDAASYYIGARYFLLETNPDDVDDRKLLPSTYLKTIIHLYHNYRNRYKDIVKLAYKVLERSAEIDSNIEREVRYWLCMSLAKSKDPRFMEEVMKIRGPEHNYIMGYYYRITGKIKEAEERLRKAIDERKNFPRARTELVNVLLIQEEFEKALTLAREVYSENSNNLHNVNAYFRSLIRAAGTIDEDIFIKLLERIKAFNTPKSEEMYYNNLAQYQAFHLHDKDAALSTITAALSKVETTIYLNLTKLEIHLRFNESTEAEATLSMIERDGYESSYLSNTLHIKRAQIYMLRHRNADAAGEIDNIAGFSSESKAQLKRKICEQR